LKYKKKTRFPVNCFKEFIRITAALPLNTSSFDKILVRAWSRQPIIMSSASELPPHQTGNRGKPDQSAAPPDTVNNLKHLAIDEGDLSLPEN